MIETARMLRSLFDRSTKVRLLFATLVAVGIAALDAIAVALVLPLVELASGGSRESDITDAISSVVPGLNEENHMVLLTALVVGLFVTKSIASIAYTWWLAGFKARNRALLSARLFQQYLSVPLVQIDTRTRGDLLRTMTEGVTQVFGSSVGALMTMVIQGLTTIFILITMIILEPVGSLALILYFLAGSLLVLRAARHRAAKAGVEAMNAARESISAALAGLGAQREVRLRAAQDYFVGRQLEAGFRSARASRVQEFLSAIPRHAMEILFIGGIGVILLIASGSGGSTIGTLAFFVAAGFRVIPSTTGILGAINNIRFGRAYLDLVLSDAKTLGPDRHPNGANVPATIDRVFNPCPHVEFRRVGFVYPGSETPALKDISFDLPFGHSLGLVGGSGSGKSTLADVLLGLRDASSGEVLVDGEPLSKNLTSWQGMIGFVPQDVFVLEGSLRENVAFGVAPENIDDKKVMGALERSQLGGLVDSLPDGLDSSLGEGGSRLSGGQRQRVGIARALYGDPRILILDEATSALDNQTEYLVSRALEQIRGDVTLVVIAHRLSTVRSMDRLLLLSEGRVGGFGSFEELRASNAEFAQMVERGSID